MEQTINIILVLKLILTHFIADFVLQTDEMAKGKSKSNKWLLIHVGAYAAPFLFFGFKFALLNGCIHFLVDWYTSRLSSYMWEKGRVHDFFTVIGADQAIHMFTLVISAKFLL